MLDKGAVIQIARTYHGYCHVKGHNSSNNILRFDNDIQEEGGSSLEINCTEGSILIRLRTAYRGQTEVIKHEVDYNMLHQVFKDPRCFFLPTIVKPKRRSSRELSGEKSSDDGPTVFSLNAYKESNYLKASVVPKLPFCGVDILDLGAPVFGGFAKFPSFQNNDLARQVSVPTQLKIKCVNLNLDGKAKKSLECQLKVTDSLPEPSREKIYGPAKPNKDILLTESLLSEEKLDDHLYRTKTKTELNYLKRKHDLDIDRLKKRAVLSHKDKIEGFNTYLSNIPEFNEQRKINWSKH